MSDLRDVIPGYREAVEQEASEREGCFLNVFIYEVCGCEVGPLTLGKMILLKQWGSAFFTGGMIQPGDVLMLMWVCSPDFIPNGLRAWWRRRRLRRMLRRMKYLNAVAECETFIEGQFFDLPGNDAAPWTGPQDESFVARAVDTFAEAYGWTYQETLKVPLPVAGQLLRRLVKRRDPNSVFINRSDKVRSEYLRNMHGGQAGGNN
ncbi:MAG: hypothetical protein AAF571_07075 [Verrucomicrobiota bacterium]